MLEQLRLPEKVVEAFHRIRKLDVSHEITLQLTFAFSIASRFLPMSLMFNLRWFAAAFLSFASSFRRLADGVID